ncbi:MAG TPA: DUF6600 domain-containing protein [Terriglobales bacterium]|nr:DUF6600 domain-containing protein [Terriglobales bacterium]
MKFRLITGIAGLLTLISSVAIAQDPAYPEQDQDQSQAQVETQGPAQAPAQTEKETGVARVSLIHGDVSTQRGDSGDWATAALNAPVVTGDKIAAGDASRAELQLDFANILRLDARTEANITALNRSQIQIQLARGLANYSVLKDSEADVEIDAPNLSVHPRRGDGNYRITVISDDRAEVVVRRGEADVSTPQGSTHVRSGQMITVSGTGADTQYRIADAPSRDDFDRWTSDRDNTIHNAQSYSHTNRYYVGSEDLDSYGHWRNVPDYGDVWVPAAASGWAPYRDGRWVWEPYWGWTWVSYEPWGWAPYHYGRWFLYDSSWVWWPGYSYGYRSYYRPIWAPAYVSFFGFGGGFGFGVGFGSVGWLPIGPCDGFYPWWGGYRSRFNTVNIYNVTNVYNIHNGGLPPLRRGTMYSNVRLAQTNEHMRMAISTVPSNDFGRGRVTAHPPSNEMFRGGKLVAGNLPVVPGRESLLAGERRANPPSIARGGQERFFSTNHTVQTRPQSFDRTAADLHNAIQRDGHFTPIVGSQRSNAVEGNPRAITQGGVNRDPGTGKPFPGLRANGPEQGTNRNSNIGSNSGLNAGSGSGSNAGSNENWRRTATPVQQPGSQGGAMRSSNGNPVGTSGNTDWRRSPVSGSQQSSGGNGSMNHGSMNSGNPTGRVNSPVDRRETNSVPQGGGNQDWRKINRPSEPVSRGVTSPTQAPVSRGSQGGLSMPTQDRGGDWRRIPSPAGNGGSMDRSPAGGSAPVTQRDSGNWRQSVPRDSGRETSRPSLDMRQPIVTPRSSGGYSGGGNSGGGYRGNPGGSYGGGGRSAPSGGGYSAPSHGGGGYSAPSGGGGHSAPSGGGGHSAPSSHSSGSGNSGPHRGR